MSDAFWYPSVNDVLAIHQAIVSESPETTPGVQNPGDIEFALEYINKGHFDAAPRTIHQKAFHLIRLLVANHPFVDGNKRTALNTATVFYLLNGYRFDYDNEIRSILKRAGTDQSTLSKEDVIEYLRTHTEPVDLNEVIERWRGDLIQHGFDQLTDEPSDPND